MRKRNIAFILASTAYLSGQPNGNWTGFRGTGDSTVRGARLPLHWSDRHNVAWKVVLPGFGQSTPVVGGGRIFLTAVEGKKKETLHILALEERTGKTLWQKSFASSRPQEAGDRVARAASTPALDGDMLYAMFDSGDLLALTTDGDLRWRMDCNAKFSPIQNGHDFGSSIRQTKDALHVFVNHVGPSYLASIAKADGKVRWKVDFPAEGGWNTPVVTSHKGKEILLLQRSGGVAAYAVKDGELLWEDLKTFSRESAIPSLTVAGDVVVVPSQAKGGTLAFRLDQPKQAIWNAKTATNAFSSPLVSRERAYFVNSVGALFAVDLATGKDLWMTRLPATTWASAILNGDKAYFFTGDGDTFVFRDAATMEKLGESHLDVDSIVYAATPLNDGLLLRSGTQLWKVADLGQTDPNPPAPRAPVQSKQEEPPPPPAAPGKPGERRRNAADGLELAWIAAGEYQMGCSVGDAECEPDESPGHSVKLTRGFWLNTTEVTLGAFRKFAAARGLSSETGNSDNLPAVRVNYATAAAYCRWAGGRLPTEAEWEFAARAGTKGPRYGAVQEVAWLADNSGKAPLDSAKLAREQRGAYMPTLKENGNARRPVGGKTANAFGLFDMLGNVAEWTADWHDTYAGTPLTDPKGPADGEKRVARGGAWTFFPAAIRVSTRLKLAADAANDFTGFRCAQ